MAKFAEAQARLQQNIFVCMKCRSKIRTTSLRVKSGKVKCRKCNSKALRTIRKK